MSSFDDAADVAAVVRQQLMKLHGHHQSQQLQELQRIDVYAREFSKLTRMIDVALSRRWFGAVKLLKRKIEFTLANLIAENTNRSHSSVPKQLPDIPGVPPVRAIVEELQQVEQDLGPWHYNPKQHTLSAKTEAIQLEGIGLGCFTIELELNELGSNQPVVYRVSAEDPNPPDGSEHVTHPHVSDDTLCEGEGHVAIRRALESGRLADFFSLVNSVLHTYNPDSAFVSLEQWEGEGCWECGVHGELNVCSVCGRDFCDDDIFGCDKSNRLVCYGCGRNCNHDDQWYHPNHITRCTTCGKWVMNDHLDQDGNCPACLEDKETQNETNQDTTPPATTPAVPQGEQQAVA